MFFKIKEYGFVFVDYDITFTQKLHFTYFTVVLNPHVKITKKQLYFHSNEYTQKFISCLLKLILNSHLYEKYGLYTSDDRLHN